MKDLGFKNVCSRAKTYTILTWLNYVHDLVIHKVKKHQQHVICLINTLAKTWLIKACDTAFYAIIMA